MHENKGLDCLSISAFVYLTSLVAILEVTLLEIMKVFSTWMAFGGNTHDLGSFGEETDEITDLHQILKEVLLTECGDDVAGIKRRHRDPSSDGVRRFSDGVKTYPT
ncbi:hypothetical protein Tco_1166603 [Tanacetum coccineum]